MTDDLPAAGAPPRARVRASERRPPPRADRAHDALTEAWRFYYDNSLDTEPDVVDRAVQKTAIRMIPPGARVLDVGTGRGRLLAALRPEVGVGIDISKRSIMDARERYPHLRFETVDVRRVSELGPVGGPFDFVVFNQSLGEMVDVIAALAALHPHVAPWTRLVVFERHRSRLPRWAPQPLRANRRDLAQLLGLGGFEPITVARASAGRLPGIRRLHGFDAWVLRPSPHLFRPADPPRVSVVLPLLRDEDVAEQLARLPDLGRECEYLLVTTPVTHPAVVHAIEPRGDARFRILNGKGESRGQAVLEGARAAEGDAVVILGEGRAETPEVVPRFLDALRHHAGDVIVAGRRVYPEAGGLPGRLTRLAGRLLARIYARRLRCRVGGVNPFLKVIRRRDLARIIEPLREDRLDDAALLLAAGRLHLKILDIPVRPPAPPAGEPAAQRWARLRAGLRFFLRALLTR